MSPLQPMVRKLQHWARLTDEEQQAVLALPFIERPAGADGYIVREGQKTEFACLLIQGFAYRSKVLVDGSRAIVAFHMVGDIVDLQNSLLKMADHNVQALGRATVAQIPREAIIALSLRFPNVGLAMWYDTLVDASICREWIANNARRDAVERLAHLLCEFGVRMEAAGLSQRANFELPMTQEQLADATGLTSVHVNRTLQELRARGLIDRTKRSVMIADWNRLADAAGFDPAYLHLQHPPDSLV